jgi:hypothetical protein
MGPFFERFTRRVWLKPQDNMVLKIRRYHFTVNTVVWNRIELWHQLHANIFIRNKLETE